MVNYDIASGLGQGMEQLLRAGENLLFPFFSALLGGTSDMLFERVLFLVIILTVVYLVVSKMDVFKGNDAIVWIISVSVSLLSTRFLVGEDLIQAMLLPYSALGIGLTAALPLLIYFSFVQSFSDSATVRKMLWVFYIVAFIMIWGSRYDDVGGLSWMYALSAVAAVLFLLFDGTIRRMMEKQRYGIMNHDRRMKVIANLEEDLDKLEGHYQNNRYTEAVYKRMKKSLIKQIAGLRKS